MTLKEVTQEIKQWRLTKQRAYHLNIGIAAVLLYEFVGRPIYRPFIYKNNIFDFHIADTLGNTLGTLATMFISLGLLARTEQHHKFLIVVTIIAGTLFELLHPLTGRPIDGWDLIATPVAGFVGYGIYRMLAKSETK